MADRPAGSDKDGGEAPPSSFRAGFVPITGLPNAGKSTLLNALCGTRLSIISEKPQTTRNNILGILNAKSFQAVFVDTPGFLKARNLFEKSMETAIKRAAGEDGDLCLLIAEPSLPPEAKFALFEPLKRVSCPLYLAINKMDKEKDKARAETAAARYASFLPIAKTFYISALAGNGVGALRSAIEAALPLHEPFYPQDQLTDRWERFYAAEIIREQIFKSYSQEIPYSAAVEIESFRETPGRPDQVMAAIHVSRQGHKPILIGKGGRAIRLLRERSLKALGSFLGRPVELQLHVKVTPGWQDNLEFLREIGFYDKK